MGDGKIMPMSGKFFASATERTQSWNGIQQEISGRVQRKLAFSLERVLKESNIYSSKLKDTITTYRCLSGQHIGASEFQV